MNKLLFTRISAVLFLLCTAFFLLSTAVYAENGDAIFEANIPQAPISDNISSAYVFNLENQKEILSYNGKNKIYPSSLTKVAAFELASKKLSGRLDEKVTVTQEMLNGTVGMHVGIRAGEVLTVKELFYIAFCGGYNDAVNVIACVCSGSVSEFVVEMNARAIELGATNTVFTNPTGIHSESMYTTASDLALIMLEAVKDPIILEITSTVKIEIKKTDEHDRYMLYNRNMLLSDRISSKYLNEYASGLNAGSTVEGGECVATLARKEGLSYLCIVTGGAEVEDEEQNKYISSYKVINDLIEWSFESFGYVKLFDPSLPCADLSVRYGVDTDTVSVVPDSEIVMYLPLTFDPQRSIDMRIRFDRSEFEAPLTKGDTVGKMTLLYGGEPLGEVGLKLTASVEKDNFLFTLDKIKAFSQNRIFVLSVVCAVGYTVLFTVVSTLLRHMGSGKRNKKKNKR